MPFIDRVCVSVECDDCGSGATEDGYLPHYPDHDDALDAITGQGWTTDGARLVCPDCTRLARCAATGHEWGAWQDARPIQRRGDIWTGRVRVCGGCPDSQWDPPLRPAASPQDEAPPPRCEVSA